MQRMRLIPFEVTFTDDKEKLAANPDIYKPKDESLKTPAFKEDHRCAFFLYVVTNGGVAPFFPEETKARGAQYLTELQVLSGSELHSTLQALSSFDSNPDSLARNTDPRTNHD